jgi:SAM-dependent methyltransferase
VSFRYQGEELDVFARARGWKAYWASQMRPWIRGDVLEVGAGLGVNTAQLQNSDVRSWHCLEPDPDLASRLRDAVREIPGCSVTTGTIARISDRQYDTILYIDVLEHIEHDRDEAAAAAELLGPGGHLIVLSPAHQFLFSEFDAAIGHYRRYNKTSLRACTPASCSLEKLFYLDAVGMLASLANRVMLRQSNPTVSQIVTWDTWLVPASRVIDPLLGRRLGKTIVGIWRRR